MISPRKKEIKPLIAVFLQFFSFFFFLSFFRPSVYWRLYPQFKYDFHILTVIYSSLYGFIWNRNNDQFPVGLLVQLVERSNGIAEVMASNPAQTWIFLSLIFTTAQVAFITAKIALIFKTSFHSFLELISWEKIDNSKSEWLRTEEEKKERRKNDFLIFPE